MDEPTFHAYLGYGLLASMAGAFGILAAGTAAPYGRYAADKSMGLSWGPPVPCRAAWCLQELPSLVVPLMLWRRPGWAPPATENGTLLALFCCHYFNRAVVYPYRIRGGKPTPLVVMLSAFGFTFVNGYLQAGALIGPWAPAVGRDSRFFAGVLLWGLGVYGNAWHDGALRRLRRSSADGGYQIPRGGLFEYVSGANFLCEILEWCGFALAARTPAAAIFAANAALNLGPRATHHHRWYRKEFRWYPPGRKALIPFVL
mmetsp:Transcript_25442/g.76405  ORF Transcript_25442/g.76405 Transcript_25442/m.76405 type:complete len:258 (+) Transcript_25442:197-970(+)